MKYAGLAWVAAITIGCVSPALTGRPLTWEQVLRVGEVTVDDPSWKGELLRLPIRVGQSNSDSPIVLHFKGEVSENLIRISASREVAENPAPDVYEALIELPKQRLKDYVVVYVNPDGGYERLRTVLIPETLREKLER
jgi:hypothetical protein